MFNLKLIALISISIALISGKLVDIHELKDVKLVGYSGPFTPESLSFFRGVETLKLLNCNITSLPGNIFSGLTNLKILDVEYTHWLNADLDDFLQGAHNLEELIFVNSSVGYCHPHIFENLKKLRVVYVEDMVLPYKVIQKNRLKSSNIEIFEFIHNGLEDIEDDALKGYQNMRILSYARNQLKSVPKKAIEALQKLKHLDLSGNLIESVRSENVPALPKLKHLSLANNPLKEFKVPDLDKLLPKLKKLDVRGTLLTEENLEELHDLKIDVIKD